MVGKEPKGVQFKGGGHAHRGPIILLLRDLTKILADRRFRLAFVCYVAVLAGLLALALLLTPMLAIIVLSLLAIALFPTTEYLVHRYVLHPLIYLDARISARFWIRAHFAHHDQPARVDVILASPVTVAMLLLVLNAPVLVIVPAATFAWMFAILGPFLFYEIVHYSIHLPIELDSDYLQARRRLHMLHHFHNEHYNFGICASMIDKLVGTYASNPPDTERSPTARNLGYDDALATMKPLVRAEYERRYLSN